MLRILILLLLVPSLCFGQFNGTFGTGPFSGQQFGTNAFGSNPPNPYNISMFMMRNNAGALSNDTDYYNSLMGVSSTEVLDVDAAYFVMPTSGTFTSFRVKWDAVLTGNMSIEYYLVINGASTLLATVDSTGSTKYNTSVNLSVSKGDLVAYKYIARNSPTITHHWLNMQFSSLTDMVIVGNNKIIHNAGVIKYFHPQGSINALQSTNSAARAVYPTSGVIKNLYVRASVAPGVGNTWTIKIVDAAFSTKATVVISDTNTTGEATISYSVNQGDNYYISIDPTGGTPTAAYFSYGSIFQPTIKGEYPLMYTEFSGVLNSTEANYNYLLGPKFYLIAGSSPVPTERRMPLMNGFTIKKHYVAFQTAPGAGKSWTVDIGNGYPSTATGLSVTISDTGGSGSDNTDRYTTIEGEEYLLKLTPSGTPTAPGRVYSSIVLAK